MANNDGRDETTNLGDVFHKQVSHNLTDGLRDSRNAAEGRTVPNKSVVLLSNRSLLASGIERLLGSMEGVELSVIAAKGPCAIASIRQLDPAVIIFDADDSSLGEGVVTNLLGQHPGARVIALALDPTGIEVFRVHRVGETDLEGFKEAIWGGPPPPTVVKRKETIGSADIENGGLVMDP
jgi:hypothetical protein